METPPKISHEIAEILWSIFDFIVRNLFGILATMAGIAYQIYQMTGRTRRLTKMQCVASVFMWFIASFAIVVGLSDSEMNRYVYGLVCWLAPVIVRPIADTVSVNASPITEKIIKALGNLFVNKVNNQE
jgi:hypothetical protein